MSEHTPPGAATPDLPQLPPRKRSKTGPIVGIVAAVVVVVVAVVLIIVNITGGTSTATGSGSKPVTVNIGTSDSSQPYWAILEKLAAKHNITIKLTNFSDYNQPNPALSQKQIDMNVFQHLQFLSQYNVDSGDNLQPIASTLIVPLSLYSKKWTSVSQIPQGGTIAIPNDPANEARALNVLVAAKLVVLTGKPASPTPADVDTAKSRVKVTTVDAAQTVLSLSSVDGSIINNNYVTDAKLDPKSALFSDDPSSPSAQPYINLIVTRAADIHNKTYLEVAKLYHDPSVLKSVVASSKGTAVIVKGYSGAKLRSLLKGIEKNVKATQ